MPGRKAVPIGIHKLKGSYQKCRHAAAGAIEEAGGVPTCPEWLGEREKAVWADLVPMLSERKTITAADGMALVVLCATFVEWKQLQSELAIEGRVYDCRTEAGEILKRVNPKMKMFSDAQRRLNSSLSEFGLSPGSRLKVGPVSDKKPQNKFAELSA